ncbi:MAG: HAD-IA family hydrolase [Kiritimatiellae bacterium]|jgi:beta-phosphoglucomutase|nr:HAD-IA family hydrolase [Kiritimatiellia bacterium]
MKKAILFDMDGVLTDTEPVILEAAIRGLKTYGVNAKPEDFIPFVGRGEDLYIGGVAEKHGKAYIPEMKKHVYDVYLEILPSMIEKIPGVKELLEQLHDANIKMAVATSADYIKMKANLEAIEVPLSWFDAIITGENVTNKKPDPEIYLKAAKAINVDPADCIVIEDAIHGVEAAKSAGCKCIAVASSFPKEELEAAGADITLDNFAQITLEMLSK